VRTRLLSLLATAISWTYLGVVSAAFIPVLLVLWPARSLRIRVFNVYGRLTGRVMIAFAGATLTPGIRARLRAPYPAIYVSNHTSYLDIFLAIWAAPIGTVGAAKQSTVLVPFFGQVYAVSGNVLINRDDRREAVRALRLLTTLTRGRMSAMIWPEGTRSPDGRLQPFKRGFAHLALATRMPIIPIVVRGAHQCWPKGAALTRPANVEVEVLEAIPTTEWTPQTIERHVDDVWQRFADALPPAQKPISEPIQGAQRP
jgi:1-acyl-sn-glycerol-3-phosphate acyltransferase